MSKLYQLIISRIDGQRLSDKTYTQNLLRLVRQGIGGFIVFTAKRDTLKDFIIRAQGYADKPLFIASDIERGMAQQVEGYSPFPCEMAVCASGSIELLIDGLGLVCEEARDCGINMPLIPVLDVNVNPKNPIICTRAFSDDPDTVSEYGKAYIETIERYGMISCCKHFPGHGSTSLDSHLVMPEVTEGMEEIRRIHLKPFIGAISAGVRGVMVGHLSIPAIDREPASLSPLVINGLLRGECGFDGLVLSDALNMGALEGISDLYAKCLDAGSDILLHPDDPDGAVRQLEGAIERGVLAPETIERAIGRILGIKASIERGGGTGVEPINPYAAEIAKRSITLLPSDGEIIPLRPDDRLAIIKAGDIEGCSFDPFVGAVSKRNRIVVEACVMDFENYELLKDTVTIVVIHAKVAAWRGSCGIGPEEEAAIRK